VDMLNRINEDAILQRFMFSDEGTFHLSRHVNHQSIRIWGSEDPCAMRESDRDIQKVSVWCGFMHGHITKPIFSVKKTVTTNVCLDILEQFVVPQLWEQLPNIMVQQDRVPQHWSPLVRQCLDRHFPGNMVWLRWANCLLRWANCLTTIVPRFNPTGLFIWGCMEDIVYANLVLYLQDLRNNHKCHIDNHTSYAIY
jgi:hypothetical protein